MVRTLENFHFETTIILSFILIGIISFSNFDAYSDDSLMFFENQLIQYANAQTDVEQMNSPLIYDIRITLMDIGDVDLANGGFEATFWITLSSDEIDFTKIPPPELNYVNGHIEDIQHETVIEDQYYAKVHGVFTTNMEFHFYPILSLDLPIIIEPAHDEIDVIKFSKAEYPTEIDSNLTIAGLLLKGLSTEIKDYQYPDEEVYTRYVATFSFDTPIFSSFMVGIFPIIILGVITLFLFTLNPIKHDIKVEVIAGVLIAAVFFHVLDVGESLPPLEYLTLEDKMMTSLYVLIVYAMAEIAIQRKYNEEEDYEKAKKINKKIRYFVPVVVIGSFAALYPF